MTAIDKIYTAGVTMTATVAEGIPVYAWNKTSFTHNTPVIFKDGKTLFDLVYPVGSIYMSVSSANPETIFGGTWVAWGAGRVPVGIDTGQTEFNTVEKTGGHKLLQSHSHGLTGQFQPSQEVDDGNYSFPACGDSGAPVTRDYSTVAGTTSTGGGNAENLQPYVVCHMWKRTA